MTVMRAWQWFSKSLTVSRCRFSRVDESGVGPLVRGALACPSEAWRRWSGGLVVGFSMKCGFHAGERPLVRAAALYYTTLYYTTPSVL